MFERTDPKTLRTWLILAALLYLLLPYDVFPDFFGLPGRIDDVLMMAWLVWLYRNHAKQFVESGFGQGPTGHSRGESSGQGGASQTEATEAFDPYEVLGVSRSASGDAIQAAYRSRMQQYHPDKVAHLGAELQELAHEKSQQIQRAYRQLHG